MKTLGEYINELKETCRNELLNMYKEKLSEEISIPDKIVDELITILKAVSNPIRLRIIYLLNQIEMPVCLITSILGIDQTLASHHLSILKDAGIVGVKTVGKFRIYYLKRKDVLDILEKLLSNR